MARRHSAAAMVGESIIVRWGVTSRYPVPKRAHSMHPLVARRLPRSSPRQGVFTQRPLRGCRQWRRPVVLTTAIPSALLRERACVQHRPRAGIARRPSTVMRVRSSSQTPPRRPLLERALQGAHGGRGIPRVITRVIGRGRHKAICKGSRVREYSPGPPRIRHRCRIGGGRKYEGACGFDPARWANRSPVADLGRRCCQGKCEPGCTDSQNMSKQGATRKLEFTSFH